MNIKRYTVLKELISAPSRYDNDYDPALLIESMANEILETNAIYVDEREFENYTPKYDCFCTYPAELELEWPSDGNLNGIYKWTYNGKRYRGNMRFASVKRDFGIIQGLKLRYVKEI